MSVGVLLVGFGFLVMAAAAVLRASLSLVGTGVLVTWAYWFGWTWISWIIADKCALQRCSRNGAATTHE